MIFNNRYRERIVFSIIVVILCFVMLYFTSIKEGFHCDEAFSYGSSNSKYENLFYYYGDSDAVTQSINKLILKGDFGDRISNIFYYLKNPDEFSNSISEFTAEYVPIWRTQEEALDYMAVTDGEMFMWQSVYYNQTRDVHPPLFYYLVNFISGFLFFNRFSKYIIFIVSLPFFIGTLIVIRKLFILLEKKSLYPLAILGYGSSMAAISTMNYQRMYMMLAFFVIALLYYNIKLNKSNFVITKKEKYKFCAIIAAGFLTHYYFCIYAVGSFIITLVFHFAKHGKFNSIKTYVTSYFIGAGVGILLFLPSIYQIFFSYRGFFNSDSVHPNGNFIELFIGFIKLIFEGYWIQPTTVALCLLIPLFLLAVYFAVKRTDLYTVSILILPTFAFLLAMTKSAPYLEIRYIMCLFPIPIIIYTLALDAIKIKKTIAFSLAIALIICLTANGIHTKKPLYLYTGYNEYLKVAESNKECNFVYFGYTFFNHIESMPEFMIYKQSKMLTPEQIDFLKDDEQLINSDEFIVSINIAFNKEEIIAKLLEYSKHTEAELLLDVQTCPEKQYYIYRIK